MFRPIVVTAMVVAITYAPIIAQKLEGKEIQLTSPNGKASIRFALKTNPTPYPKGIRPYYNISYEGKLVIKDSSLGIVLKGGAPLERNFSLIRTVHSTLDESYSPVYGVKRTIKNHCHQAAISLEERGGQHLRMDIIFRAYDEGVAFRYVFPGQEAFSQFELQEEESTFYFPQAYTAWALQLGKYTSNYESEFNKIAIWEITPQSIIGLPLLIQTTNREFWMAILEAAITNYAGMYLSGLPGVPEALVSKLSPLPSNKGLKVKATLPLKTPWRVLLLGKRPGDLIESNYLLLNLNDPCAISDPSWIKPGKAAWNWWSGTVAKGVNFQPGMNTPTMKHYVDFAAEHHLEYLVIDAGWYIRSDDSGDLTKMIPETDIPEIVRYGKERQVGIILWLHWSLVDAQMEKAFPLYEQWGVAGVKIDFMDRDDQGMVNFYLRVARKASQHRLLVDFHGAYKPDGLQRTWPNLITREAVLGLEYNKWSSRCTPKHDVTLPFTRMLAGPMDYTPGAFRTATRKQFSPRQQEPFAQGTRCHQLAMYVVFESPLQMLSDYPEAYRNQPGIEFLERVPTTWDETRVLLGQVGEYIAIARRHGQEWYVGSMTNWEPRTLRFPLDFLSPGRYRAEVYSDSEVSDEIPNDLIVQEVPVSASYWTAKLAPGGGQAIRFFPAARNKVRRALLQHPTQAQTAP